MHLSESSLILRTALKGIQPLPEEIITEVEDRDDSADTVLIYGDSEYWLQLGKTESGFWVIASLNNFPNKGKELYDSRALLLPDVAIAAAITTIRKDAVGIG